MATHSTETQQPAMRILLLRSGQEQPIAIPEEKMDKIVAEARWLLENAEPQRVALEEEQMNALKTGNTWFELLFIPHLNADTEKPAGNGPNKLLFLQSGDYANSEKKPDIRFFIAISDNGQYISSPYIATGAANKLMLLQQLLIE